MAGFRSTETEKDRNIAKRSKGFWREPLIHFFVLGLALFGLHAVLDRRPEAAADDPYLVEISSADIEWMQTMFTKQMGRQPTGRDLRGRVNQLIREQVLSREAVAMGIDKGDAVVRRRLAQKMEFLFKDLAAMSEPTADELQRFFAANRQKYEIPAQVTFAQVFFSGERRGGEGAGQAVQALIDENPDPDDMAPSGDASILPLGCSQCSQQEIANRFGTAFGQAMLSLEPGAWQGPVRSPYGYHAVYIRERREARLPSFAQVEEQVKNDWLFAKQEENTRKVYGKIRSRYRVLVEGLPYDLDAEG
jgi:parvulin-like peptidyl-prolyl isomerase